MQLNGSSTVAQNWKSDVLECFFHLFSSLFSWRLLEHISGRSQGQAAVFQSFINAIIKRLIFLRFNSFTLMSRGVKIEFLVFLITSAFSCRSERSVLRGPLMRIGGPRCVHFLCSLTAAVASLLRGGAGGRVRPAVRATHASVRGCRFSSLSSLCADSSTFVTSVCASELLPATQPQRL